ncbi:hypothetical protein [Asaia platycodi]|uniref:hypothetical protein n=1 Tax=Asaia platycodi TaxID=610243 RepID=UPI0004722C84|nr:hypothetical protein [Asaia platycodi]
MDNSVWDECLKDFSVTSCRTLFIQTRIDEIDVDSEEKKVLFKEFLSYGMNKNIIIEFDYNEDRPIFSGDTPEEVADRILSDWPKRIIRGSLVDDDEYYLFFITLEKFAQLWHGTRIGYVG